MRNLLQFLWKYHFALFFVFVQSISFIILVRYNSFHKANFLGYTNEVSGNAFEFVNQTTDYLKLKDVNQQLAAENAMLRSKQQDAYKSLNPRVIYFNDTAHLMQYEYVAAKVVNGTTNKRNNYITLNKGDNSFIEPQMGVISEKGVVGIIKAKSTNYSSVISLLHKSSRISTKLKNNEYFGILSWNGSDPRVAQLDDIPAHVNISEGDTVVTRGSGGIFPEGIMVGTVRSFEEIKGTDFYQIDVQLSVDFKNVSYVYVVRNHLKTELKALEDSSEVEVD